MGFFQEEQIHDDPNKEIMAGAGVFRSTTTRGRPPFSEARSSPPLSGAAHIAWGFVLPQPFIDDVAQQAVGRPGQVSDFGDKLGRTQCTRVSTSGLPKRVVFGGGTSTVILSEASGRSFFSKAVSSDSVMPVPARPA